jgi:hypothetical protein
MSLGGSQKGADMQGDIRNPSGEEGGEQRNPIRVALGAKYVGMDLYELRHFCGSYLFNNLELPAEAVAQQLGHTDGGALVRKRSGTRMRCCSATEWPPHSPLAA